MLYRLIAAISTFPTLTEWVTSGCFCLLLAITLIPIGMAIGFLELQVVQSQTVVLQVMAIAFISPAITEELFFRVLLLPHPTESVAPAMRWFWICFSLVLFILYHPANALTFFPSGRKTFMDGNFLLLAGLLGMVCTIAYLQTGSLWLPVALHWLAVVIWLLLLGGYGRLYADQQAIDSD